MVIINKNGLLGDSLSTLPAIWAKVQKEQVYLISENQEVARLLFDHPNLIHVKNIKRLFDAQHETQVRYLDATQNFNAFCGKYHMAQGHYYWLGLPIPTEVPTCPLNDQEIITESFDFLISAGSRSDMNNNKLIPVDRWQLVIDWLVEQGYSVGALRAAEEKHKFDNCTDLRGYSLSTVISYIKNVKKGLLSIDNGISHLTRIIDVPHLLLYPQCLPLNWVNNPNKNALSYQINPSTVTVSEMQNLILGKFLL